MGVRGFLSFIKPIRKRVTIEQEKNLQIGIDAFCLMYTFREERDKFEAYLRKLLQRGHTLTFIFDRRAQKEKKAVVEARKQKKEEARTQADNLTTFTQSDDFEELEEHLQQHILQKIAEKEWVAWCLYAEYTEWLLNLLQTLHITVIKAKEEADILLAKGAYDVVISSDTDMFVLGCRRVWLPTDSFHYEYLLQNIEEHVGLPHESFCELAYLVGCDVQPKKKMEIDEAISNLRFYGSLLGIHSKQPNKITAEDLEHFAALKKAVWT
jgi:5'-3' exonuclease